MQHKNQRLIGESRISPWPTHVPSTVARLARIPLDRLVRIIAAALIAVSLAACAAQGPRRLEGERFNYNEAIAASNLNTVVGPVAWNGANLPPFAQANVAKTPLVGGQWRLKDGGGYDLVIVDNQTAPDVPTGGTMEAIT